MARHPHVDLTVAYCSLQGAEAGYDPEFSINVKWDVPLLDGYSWTEVPNRSLHPGLGRFFGLVNPGLWTLIRRGRFDAVISFTGYVYATFWIGLLATKLCRVPVFFGTDASSITPRDSNPWKRSLKLAAKRIFWPLLFRAADRVITASSRGTELIKSIGISEERILMGFETVDNDWWLAQAARANREAVREAWRVTPEQPVILFCGKLQSWKRPLDLLEAFSQTAIPGAVLVYAGSGPEGARIEARTSALGLGHRVRLLGFVNQSQLPGVYKASDLMVIPSEYEPFGLVVNESMLCECPVVASDKVGAVGDLIVDGRTGFVYPCGDTAALAAVLRRAFSNRERLAEIARTARQRVRAWSVRESVAAYVDGVAKAVCRPERAVPVEHWP